MIAIQFHESVFHVHCNSVLVIIYRVAKNLHNKFLIRNRQPWTGNWNNGSVSRTQYSLSDIHLNFSTSICIPRYYVTHGIFWLCHSTHDTLGILALVFLLSLPLNGDHQLFELWPLTHWIKYCVVSNWCLLVNWGRLKMHLSLEGVLKKQFPGGSVFWLRWRKGSCGDWPGCYGTRRTSGFSRINSNVAAGEYHTKDTYQQTKPIRKKKW